jgi:hypothetical protein
MIFLRWIYPSLVGMLLGLLQTGLFFQLAFTLSSSFRTFLMITVCWLLGSAVGLQLARRVTWALNWVLVLALGAYFGCVLLLALAPFQTQIWPLYAGLIVLMGLYPGLFFVRLSSYYTARTLFFRENNGFILGLMSGTLLFLVMGRSVLWTLPILVGSIVILCTTAFFREPTAHAPDDHHTIFKPLKEIKL